MLKVIESVCEAELSNFVNSDVEFEEPSTEREMKVGRSSVQKQSGSSFHNSEVCGALAGMESGHASQFRHW